MKNIEVFRKLNSLKDIEEGDIFLGEQEENTIVRPGDADREWIIEEDGVVLITELMSDGGFRVINKKVTS